MNRLFGLPRVVVGLLAPVALLGCSSQEMNVMPKPAIAPPVASAVPAKAPATRVVKATVVSAPAARPAIPTNTAPVTVPGYAVTAIPRPAGVPTRATPSYGYVAKD